MYTGKNWQVFLGDSFSGSVDKKEERFRKERRIFVEGENFQKCTLSRGQEYNLYNKWAEKKVVDFEPNLFVYWLTHALWKRKRIIWKK